MERLASGRLEGIMMIAMVIAHLFYQYEEL